MVNILPEGYDIAAPGLRAELKRHIRPEYRVATGQFIYDMPGRQRQRLLDNGDARLLGDVRIFET